MFFGCSFLSWLSCLCWVFFLLLFVCLLFNYVIQVVVTPENLNGVFCRIMSFKLWSRPAQVARLLDFIFVNLIVLYCILLCTFILISLYFIVGLFYAIVFYAVCHCLFYYIFLLYLFMLCYFWVHCIILLLWLFYYTLCYLYFAFIFIDFVLSSFLSYLIL